MGIKGMLRFSSFCAFEKEFAEGKVLVFKEDGTRSTPTPYMKDIILEIENEITKVYAILDGSMTYDFLYYSFLEEENKKLNNKVKPKFEESSDCIITSPAYVINKNQNIREHNKVRFTTINKNGSIVSLRRFSNMEHWEKMTAEYMNIFKK